MRGSGALYWQVAVERANPSQSTYVDGVRD
jgi:hypothetical protein